MARNGGLPVFVVGTRFQVIMADSIRRHLEMRRYEVVKFFQEPETSSPPDRALEQLVANAEKVVTVDRRKPALWQLFELSRRTHGAGREVFLAAIANPLLMTIFRVNPNARLFTFDEGSYNIDPAGPFHNHQVLSGFSVKKSLYRIAHPRGAVDFAKRISRKHYTPFPEGLNVFRGKCERVSVEWMRYADPNEVQELVGCKAVLVLPCLKDVGDARRAEVLRVANCGRFDLIIRHPRDTLGYGIASSRLRSPVESVIDALRLSGAVQVFHFGSTVGLTLAAFDGVEIVDLSSDRRAFEQ